VYIEIEFDAGHKELENSFILKEKGAALNIGTNIAVSLCRMLMPIAELER
jgi:hypothetical protein